MVTLTQNQPYFIALHLFVNNANKTDEEIDKLQGFVKIPTKKV